MRHIDSLLAQMKMLIEKDTSIIAIGITQGLNQKC